MLLGGQTRAQMIAENSRKKANMPMAPKVAGESVIAHTVTIDVQSVESPAVPVEVQHYEAPATASDK